MERKIVDVNVCDTDSPQEQRRERILSRYFRCVFHTLDKYFQIIKYLNIWADKKITRDDVGDDDDDDNDDWNHIEI